MFLFIIHSDHQETLYKYFGLGWWSTDFNCSLKNTCDCDGRLKLSIIAILTISYKQENLGEINVKHNKKTNNRVFNVLRNRGI